MNTALISSDPGSYMPSNQLTASDPNGTSSFAPLNNDWIKLVPGYFTYFNANTINVQTAINMPNNFQIGDRLRVRQTGDPIGSYRYFFITKTNTNSIEIEGGNNYTFVNLAVIEVAYSKLVLPSGFPGADSFIKTDDLGWSSSGDSYTMTAKSLIFWMLGNKVEMYYDYSFQLNSPGAGAGAFQMELPLPISRNDATKLYSLSQGYTNGIAYYPDNGEIFPIYGFINTTNKSFSLIKYEDTGAVGGFNGVTSTWYRTGVKTYRIRGYISYLVKN